MGCLTGLFNCSRSIRKQTFELPIHSGPTQLHQLTGGKDPEEDSQIVTFADFLRFDRIGETIQAFACKAITQGSSGEAFAGLFTVPATLREGSTGGPPGFATEQFVVAGDLQFVRRLEPPRTPPGIRSIVPGQIIVRVIPEGQLAKVDDRYWIELPASKDVDIWIEPSRWQHEFAVTLTRDGVEMPSKSSHNHYIFRTDTDGTHEIRISGKAGSKEPDRYSFDVAWGKITTGGSLAAREVVWRDSMTGKGK